MTPSRTRGYGSRPHVTRLLLLPALALAAALAACGPGTAGNPPPLDRFYFPVGVAAVPVSGGTAVLVSSTNFDLLYDPASGGTVISVDPLQAAGPALPPAVPLPPAAVHGSVRIPSFGGPIAVADAGACGLPASLALLASRYSDELYRIAIDAAGGLSCGAGCALRLDPRRTNPYGVTIACRRSAGGTVVRHDAFVTYLRAAGAVPEVSQIDLTSADGSAQPVALDFAATGRHAYASAYDALADHLWVTGQVAGSAPLWVVDLATPCDRSAAGCPVVHLVGDLYPFVPGAEPRGIALSTPDTIDPVTAQPFPRRAYVAARVYDPDLATSVLARPGFDVAAKLFVLDVGTDVGGNPTVRIARVVDLPLGADEVKLLSVRPGKRDLLAISCVEEGTVVLYDDDVGAVVKTFGASSGPSDTSHMPEAAPRTGRQPVGLAVVPSGAVDRLYVTAFLSDVVQVIEVDPQQPARADFVETIGEIRK